MRRYGLIYNPRSGGGRRADILHGSVNKLRALGHEVREYISPEDPFESALAAVREGCDVLVACGGDGTVNAVARALQTHQGITQGIMAVLPLGTLNHFAKDLGIFSLADAERVLTTGRIREIDAGFVNGHLFVNNSGIGIYPMMVVEREKVRRAGIPKWPAFLVACVRTLAKMPFQRLHLDADGTHLTRSSPFLFVGNNVYTIEGKSLGRRQHLEEGVLSVCLLRHAGPWGLFRLAARAIMGTVHRDREFTALTAKRLTVSRKKNRRVHVSLDGEVRRIKTPLEYSTAPRAIRVLAP